MKQSLTDLPTSHPVRRASLAELHRLYPELPTPQRCTLNDLLALDVTHATLPPREATVSGLFSDLPTKHPLRNQPFTQLHVDYWSPLRPKWTHLRKADARNQYTYNTLPALQLYRLVWRYRP